MDDAEEQRVARLEQEYTPLDSALVRAIAADYDTSKPAELKTLCDFLDTLRASAVAEESSAFDPSGTSNNETSTGQEGRKRAGQSNNGSGASTSAETDSTSISAALSGLSIDSGSDSQEGRALDEFAGLASDDKISMLADLFPTLKTADIAFTLKKSGGDISSAMDVLLNHVFFEESSKDGDTIHTRGIEAFSEDNVIRRTRKKKAKGKKFQSLDEHSVSSSESPASVPNKWELAESDVTFISSRVNMPYKTVSSIYHKSGATRQTTIAVLVNEFLRDKGVSGGAQLNENVIILSQDFPSLSFEQCAALIELTTPSSANAHELSKALVAVAYTPSGDPEKLIPQYAPTKIVDEDAEVFDNSFAAPTCIPGNSAALLTARSDAFDRASQYHRKARSDRLMGGAALYYSSLGREYSSSLKVASAAEADALVSSQSSALMLDLHGVSVKEATRIACQRVQGWWNGLGEDRIRGGGRPGLGVGYQIITGVGRHSLGGVGKLGPAVMKALLREGWKVEVSSGVLTVTGRMKR